MSVSVNSLRYQIGTSMVEVLVSLAISAVALLALAGVNAASIRYSKMSQYRATATLLANDVAERMRANKGSIAAGDGFLGGAYDFVSDFVNQQAASAELPEERCDSVAVACTGAQIAALDLAQWRILVRDQLPNGSVFLNSVNSGVGTPRYAMDVWVVWRDPAVRDADESAAAVNECPNALNSGDDSDSGSIRCSYFRINI